MITLLKWPQLKRFSDFQSKLVKNISLNSLRFLKILKVIRFWRLKENQIWSWLPISKLLKWVLIILLWKWKIPMFNGFKGLKTFNSLKTMGYELKTLIRLGFEFSMTNLVSKLQLKILFQIRDSELQSNYRRISRDISIRPLLYLKILTNFLQFCQKRDRSYSKVCQAGFEKTW